MYFLIFNNFFVTYFEALFLNFCLIIVDLKFLFLFSVSLIFLGLLGFVFCKKTVLHLMLCIELIFIGNFMTFMFASLSLDDFSESCSSFVYGIFILTVAASESAISLGILLINYKLNGSIFISNLRHLVG